MKPLQADDFPTLMVLVFFLATFPQIARTAALTITTSSPLELINASDIFPLRSPSLNATSPTPNHFAPTCAPSDDDDEWYNEHVQVKWRYDATCYEALRLFSKEIARHDDEDFEFLAPDAQPTTKLKTMQTPRRYTFGGSGVNPNPSCTVVVAMLDFASPGQLPGQPPGPFRATDVASFGGLVDAGEEIFTQCIRARGVGILPDLHFGWMRAGEDGNIGVFFTGTKSILDRSISRGVHP